MSIVFPPTLVGEYTIRLSDWTPFLVLNDKEVCPIFKLTAVDDPFGCQISPSDYQLPFQYRDFKDGVVTQIPEEVRVLWFIIPFALLWCRLKRNLLLLRCWLLKLESEKFPFN
jgi:hypothetical protein